MTDNLGPSDQDETGAARLQRRQKKILKIKDPLVEQGVVINATSNFQLQVTTNWVSGELPENDLFRAGQTVAQSASADTHLAHP